MTRGPADPSLRAWPRARRHVSHGGPATRPWRTFFSIALLKRSNASRLVRSPGVMLGVVSAGVIDGPFRSKHSCTSEARLCPENKYRCSHGCIYRLSVAFEGLLSHRQSNFSKSLTGASSRRHSRQARPETRRKRMPSQMQEMHSAM